MSDTPQGPGWWQASDGRWHPLNDDDVERASPAGGAPPLVGPTKILSMKPVKARRRFPLRIVVPAVACLLAAFVAGIGVQSCQGGADGGGIAADGVTNTQRGSSVSTTSTSTTTTAPPPSAEESAFVAAIELQSMPDAPIRRRDPAELALEYCNDPEEAVILMERGRAAYAWKCPEKLPELEAVKASRDADTRKRGAARTCYDAVRAQLKAPATAVFRGLEMGGTYVEIPIDDRVEGEGATVSSYVDSQNGFGAVIRSGFTCTLRLAAPDSVQWTVVDVRFTS